MTASPMLPLVSFLQSLPASMDEATAEFARLHVLDTVAAVVSGMDLDAGQAALRHARRLREQPESRVLGAPGLALSARSASLVNAMAAHADETDDSHEPSRTHPGCAVVPVALACAERDGADGRRLLTAVVAGYEICGRITRALWPDPGNRRGRGFSTHSVGGLFGGLGSAGVLAGLDEEGWRSLFAYGAQRSGGIRTYLRGADHVEKAYVFAGMGASAAVEIAEFVASGWVGVPDAFSGTPNFLDTFGPAPDPGMLTRGLGADLVVAHTNIKSFPVGSPIQAPLQAVLEAMREHGLGARDVTRVHVRLPASLAEVVTDREMPNIDLAYCVWVAVMDGGIGFEAVHDEQRFNRWRSSEQAIAVVIEPDGQMQRRRQATVRVVTTTGACHEHHVDHVRGTAENPMDAVEIEDKARALLEPRLGASAASAAVAASRGLADGSDVGAFVGLLQG